MLPFQPSTDPATLHALQTRYRSLSKQLNHLMPSQPYIVVDTARNHLYIKRRDHVMLDALASTGSGTILDKPGEPKASGCLIPHGGIHRSIEAHQSGVGEAGLGLR